MVFNSSGDGIVSSVAQARVALFVPCYVDLLRPEVGLAALALLATVHVVRTQHQMACVAAATCYCRYPGSKVPAHGNRICYTMHRTRPPGRK